jgi:predicted helicase
MLAQHILTLPVFQALFADTDFPTRNVVGQALQGIVDKLDAAAVGSETEGLQKFYDNVRERVALAKSDKSKQDIIRNLYDTFFNNAFPRMAERLGIVYTPVQVVDFILHSANSALRKHFGESLGSEGVHILDPFSGTGTFPVRLIQSGLINRRDLPRKFASELHANEIVLLAYYIATINIETAYHGVMGEYLPFDGMVLTDTFQMTEDNDLVDKVVLPENNARVERQLAEPIRVIVGNPPYSAQQDSENDNNKNLAYPTLDGRIRQTYAAQSGAKLVKNLYDSYIRAIRWASNRIGERGIVAFVTNGSFLDANNMDGLRKCLTQDYSHLYIFNLRGNARTQGEERRKEGGGIFGEGSRTPVVVSIMVKDPAHAGPCELRYHDIGDYLTQQEKLDIVERFGGIDGMDWRMVRPNAEGDWVNQRDPAFEGFVPLGARTIQAALGCIFDVYSLGVFDEQGCMGLQHQAVRTLEPQHAPHDCRLTTMTVGTHTKGVRRQGFQRTMARDTGGIVETDPRRISWSSSLLPDARRGKSMPLRRQSLIVKVCTAPSTSSGCISTVD